MKKILAVDSRIDKEILYNLSKINNDIILVAKNPAFEESVSAHPDMNFLQIRDVIFTYPSTNVRGVNVKEIKPQAAGKLSYPDDVGLNAVCIGNDFICRKNSVSKQALEFAQNSGMNIIDVNQGYVKCNIAVVDEDAKAVITEDVGIEKILKQSGYDVLLLKNHDVSLAPYTHGFIGGASGKVENVLLFTGDITKHGEYERISAFCKKYGVEAVSLSKNQLYDYGSILTLEIK